jgi:type II secretory pathway component PulM
MPRATSEDWRRYPARARHRRRIEGGNPLARYLERKDTREKRFFIGSSLLLFAVVAVLYSVLMH